MGRSIPLQRFDDMPVMAPHIFQEHDNQPNPNIIRLNLNENPLPPSPDAIAAMHDAVDITNRYPDHSCSALAQIISARIGISTDRLVFGNGSGEMLFAAAAIAVDRNEQAVLPGPTFAPVGKNVRLAGGKVVTVPVLENGSNNVDAMLDAVNEHTALFYLCTPNSPTGGLLDAEQIKLAVDKVPSDCLLMVDEAYHEFAAWEGGPDVLSLLAPRSGPWAVMNYLEMVLDTVSCERQRLSLELENCGLRVYPSAANFLLARTDSSSDAISAKLAEHHTLVQALPWPDENGSLRITIGTAFENDIFLSALTKTL